MEDSSQQRAKDIFNDALERPPSERSAFLQSACADDVILRAQVSDLLAAQSEAGEFLASPTQENNGAVPDLETVERQPLTEGPGAVIGRYKLLEEIGTGGFGTVFMAEQREPVVRKVALKVIKLGMDTRQVIARFEQERQALAMMDHPNIARVLDGGATEAGRPYFVMELVRGESLTRFCDEQELTVRQRMELFIDVCHAVQHAHTKGVIHRDIKPSNVLVTLHDDKRVPKVIDFGIAKATHQRLTDKTLFTEFRQFVGTPEYMSPEQAQLSGLDIDTRSDVYSLGVLLYELLTGVTPFDRQVLLRSSLDELRRIIREVEPPKPSTRLSSLLTAGIKGTTDPEIKSAQNRDHDSSGDYSLRSLAIDIAKHRRTEPAALAKTIRGDLDWIVMKCLEKDRTRRYETANDLAADVDRYLAEEPVLAAPPSRLYRLRKQLRRHRLPVAIVCGFVTLIAVGLVVSLTLWQGASAARDAESGQRARAAAVSAFLTEMLTAADPAKAKGEKLTVREALDAAAKRIDERPVKDQPLVEADVRFTIGSTYLALALYPQAEAQLRAADALRSRELGDEHPDTLRTRSKLAETLVNKTDYVSAALIARPTLEAQRRVLGANHADTLETMVNLGSALTLSDQFVEAESLLRAAVEGRHNTLGENHRHTADAMDGLGDAYLMNSYPEKAEPLHRQALRIHTEKLGPEDPATLLSMSMLGSSLHNQSRNEEAEAVFRMALQPALRVWGPEHRETIRIQGNLAGSLNRQGRYTEAEAIFREVLAANVRNFGATDRSTINTQRWLANCLVKQRNYPEAETLLREALKAAREKYGLEHGDTSIRLMCALASVLATQRKDPEAEQVARQVLQFQYRQLPRPWPSELDQSSSALIGVLQRRGANDEALRIEQELIESWLAAAHQPEASASMFEGASRRLLYPANEKLRDAPQALELALQANERSGQQNQCHLRTLAQAYMLTGDSARATQVWEQAIALLPDDQSRAVMLNGAAWELLTVTPETQRDPAEALRFALRANELSDYENPIYLDTLAFSYHRTGETGKAIEFQETAISLLAADAPNRAEYEDRLREYQAASESAVDKR